MYRKWKSVSALGMAALLGCLMPMGTMLAAEENTEVVQEIEADSASDTEAVVDDEAGLDENENVDDEVNADDGNAGDEINADDEDFGDEVNVDDENVDDEAIADDEVDTDNDANDGIEVMSEATETEAGDTEVPTSLAAPVIDIKWDNQSYTYSLGDEIDYKYINNRDQAFECSVSQDGQPASFSYYLDKVEGSAISVKGTDKMSSLDWKNAQFSQETIPFDKDKDAIYVLYVKVEGAAETTYARSGVIVVDTIAPETTQLVDGGTYPEGFKFQATDKYLESVKVNGVDVTSGWLAYYQVSANGTSTSCEICLMDKAGNEKIYRVNVSKELAKDDVISTSGIYSLEAGTSYKLAEGKWQVGGDSTVYQGGSTFYVTAGNYSFTKR